MSASSVLIAPVLFPSLPPTGSAETTVELTQAPTSLSWIFQLPGNIRTLSTNNAHSGQDVQGLLYTPDIPPDDTCYNATAASVPQNVTRRADIPVDAGGLVAVAPWVSPECTLKYLSAASREPTQGFIFFLDDGGMTMPPMPNSAAWDLGDGGSWKQANNFPVYVVPGASGENILQHSALYSGNMTSVPFGHDLTEQYDPRDYVRLYVDINTGSGTSLPSLWAFLLVVLGILLAIIGVTSLTMHWLQRRRRQSLRTRVANGEVDLEALGIKRLTVPQEVLDGMPLYTYGTGAPATRVRTAVATTTKVRDKAVALEKDGDSTASRPGSPLPTIRPSAALIRENSYHPSAAQQPTCAICLDDFVAASPDATPPAPGTTVRELPCRHIYHPECVDNFLRESSSLCPLCKKTALPQGYCPRTVTNAMVRRERMMRRLRERVPAGEITVNDMETAGEDGMEPLSLGQRFRTRTFSGMSALTRNGRRISSAPTPGTNSAETEMSLMPPSAPPLARSATHRSSFIPQRARAVQPAGTPERRNWARRRAEAMLGARRAPANPEAEESRSTATWRKALRGVFPGFRSR